MADQSLQGSCSCGRNQYEIVLPREGATQASAQVLFGGTADICRAHGSSFPTLLRIPLPWLQSTTYAFSSDERHSDIRRVFSPISAPQTKRNFCGICGTSLTFWSEETQDEANFICVNMSSLEKSSLDLLDALKLLPTVDDEPMPRQEHREIRGQPWVEELIENGPLGRLKRRRGGQTLGGTSVVEWEVIEVEEETSSKRLMVGGDGDVSMRGN